jgi:hypothetical protein
MAILGRWNHHPFAPLPILGHGGAPDFFHDFLLRGFSLRGLFLCGPLFGPTHTTSSVKVINTRLLYPYMHMLSTKKCHKFIIILSDGCMISRHDSAYYQCFFRDNMIHAHDYILFNPSAFIPDVADALKIRGFLHTHMSEYRGYRSPNNVFENA